MLPQSFVARAILIALILALAGCASMDRSMHRFDSWLGSFKSRDDGGYLATCNEPGNTFDATTAPPCESALRRHCPNGFNLASVGATENPSPRSFTEKYRVTALAYCK
ncbi:hypothetical protein VDF98_03440 [Xanthomonas campestris pv. raphani]|uniref:hypothetical protein n=1 Tax=Pseudomonadota TaxID=1224 RepID=UPI001E4EAD99|nr:MULTISPECIES: hypothetical protein [Pseudomonadota]MCC4586461.1 hypothetical protein [Xanthomonas sp. NCPPB 1067]MEA9578769.1 hypothetical protein [Xanthomonas nasturtii]MEA9585957.1 hypothetical protein [Xanthomonas sp. WHRI 10064B]MEA9614384.1 hypothetical protein [Xanthomonas sp. WHRI 10064A]MEA9822410.1 hypothetical protein [Xanthomonas campestris pv. raphani]